MFIAIHESFVNNEGALDPISQNSEYQKFKNCNNGNLPTYSSA